MSVRRTLRRFGRRLRRMVIADEPDNTIYALQDQLMDGYISRATYEARAQAAFRKAALTCDDCHRTDGTHDLTVEH